MKSHWYLVNLLKSNIDGNHTNLNQKQPFTDVHEKFAIFTGKHLYCSLFLIKIKFNFIRKRFKHRCLLVTIAILETVVFIVHLRWLLFSEKHPWSRTYSAKFQVLHSGT